MDLDRYLQIKLRDRANRAVWDAAWGSYPSAGPTDEVKWLRNLIEVGVPLIEMEWLPLLGSASVNMRLRGHVCHGHPWVKFLKHSTRCELGDFLVVHDHYTGTGFIKRRAVIVQAKIFYENGGVRAKNNLQLELFKDWPQFTYESWPGGIGTLAANLKNRGLLNTSATPFARDIKKNGQISGSTVPKYIIDTGCKYGLIDIDYSKSLWGTNYRKSPWRLCSPHATPSVYTSKNGYKFGTFLVQMLRGETGRPVQTTSWPKSLANACNWSLMVKELMTLSNQVSGPVYGSPVPLSASNNPYIKHSIGEHEGFGGRSDGPKTPPPEEPEGGFSIIILQTTDSLEEFPDSFDEY